MRYKEILELEAARIDASKKGLHSAMTVIGWMKDGERLFCTVFVDGVDPVSVSYWLPIEGYGLSLKPLMDTCEKMRRLVVETIDSRVAENRLKRALGGV